MTHPTLQVAQLIEEASNRDDFLHDVLRTVLGALRASTCSVFLEDEFTGDLVLAASEGDAHGLSRLDQLPRVVNDGRLYWVDDALDRQASSGGANGSASPPKRQSVLGVPIRRDRRIVGAIVLHGLARDAVTGADEALLLTLSVQVAHALRKMAYATLIAGEQGMHAQVQFDGAAGAPGVAIAHAVFPALKADLGQIADRDAEDPGVESDRYRRAVRDLLSELRTGRERLNESWPDGLDEVLEVYQQIATDDRFTEGVLARIGAGKWAPYAVGEVVSELCSALAAAEDERLRARAEDVRAVGRRLLLHLTGAPKEESAGRCILVGSEVSLAWMAQVPTDKLAGIVCFEGSTLSHAALLARSLGIPAVMGIGQLSREDFASSLFVVDGYAGRVIIDPLPRVLGEFQRLEREEQALAAELRAEESRQARTLDGIDVPVRANIALLADVSVARAGAQGVGLYRTEFPYMLRDSLPEEEEQVAIYREILEAFAPEPVTMRTLDVGGDKPLSYIPGAERNPFLGVRGIRVSLNHPELFVSQIRAMLRASQGLGNLRVLLPMVSTLSEVLDAQGLIERARASLSADGIDTIEPPVGIMVEVPSLLFQLEALARHVDFFSIGTNDLTQYLMAAAREDPELADLHDHLQPAVCGTVGDRYSASMQPSRVSVWGTRQRSAGGGAIDRHGDRRTQRCTFSAGPGEADHLQHFEYASADARESAT